MPDPSGRLTRRRFLTALGAVSLAGCANSPALRLAGYSFGLGRNADQYPVTRAQIDEQPFAAMAARVGSAPWAVMVLAQYDGSDLQWIAADRVVLVTRQGRLMKTVGLARDLRQTVIRGPDPVQGGLHRPQDEEQLFHRIVDVTPRDYGMLIRSRYQVEGEETITILDRQHATLRVKERLQAPEWGWTAVNRYWVDPGTGFVWRSRQQFCPDQDALTLEVLTPAA